VSLVGFSEEMPEIRVLDFLIENADVL